MPNGPLLQAQLHAIILSALGNSLVVGRRTLDPLGKVRILLPQLKFIFHPIYRTDYFSV